MGFWGDRAGGIFRVRGERGFPMTYEWAITRQVRWLILLLLVILIAILVIDVRSSERWMSHKEGYWTGDWVVLALGRRDREAGVMLVWQIQMHRL